MRKEVAWSAKGSTEGHLIGCFLATTICVVISVTYPDLPRPSWLEWGSAVPFGASTVVFGLALGAVMTVPIGLGSLPVALLLHRFATRHCGYSDVAHMLAAMVVTLVAMTGLFIVDGGPFTVPWSYILVNVPVGALGGLVHVRVLANHERRRAEEASRAYPPRLASA